MKLFFVGGITRTAEHMSQAFEQAASELGYISAEHGHTILVGSDSRSTLDYHVVVGVNQYAQEHPNKQLTVEVHYADKGGEPYSTLTSPTNVTKIPKPYERLAIGTYSHLLSHIGGLFASDVVIAMAGGDGTYRIGSVAAQVNKPILALKQFGGSSGLLYDNLKYVYASSPQIGDTSFCLAEVWKGRDTANRIVNLAERLQINLITARSGNITSHTYFISYSWKDADMADHVELVLRRASKVVLRDENDIKPSASIPDSIKQGIEETDTFLVLVSKNSEKSDWCKNELAYAIDRRKQVGRPMRIVALLLDDIPRPFLLYESLCLAGGTRAERELSLIKLMQTQNQ